jgi:hypothetical protein
VSTCLTVLYILAKIGSIYSTFFSFQISFEAVRGKAHTGDIGIDDVQLKPEKCSKLAFVLSTGLYHLDISIVVLIN